MENSYVESWLASHFGKGIIPPFSFKYDSKSSAELISNWRITQQEKELDRVRKEKIFSYIDPNTNLRVLCECILFKDFPAIEWMVRFRNGSAQDTPIIEDIQALDVTFTTKGEQYPILHRALGSSAAKSDFAPISEDLKPDSSVVLAPVGGRSSNTTALPFFNVEGVEEGGLIIGVGWSGQWASSFVRGTDQLIHVRAGMELTHLKLHQNEEIRTPRVLLLFWKGSDYLQGHNLLRRFVLQHHMPKKNGKPVDLMLACSASSLYDEANKATQQNQIDFASRFAPLGVEYHWIDAGWYEGGWPNGVGNWFIDRTRFPNGLRPVSDALKKMGMGLILWFEPERVHQGTWLDREHPEWVLKLPGSQNGLLNLGNEGARRWLTEHISGMINSEGIGVYRQDFNMDPLAYWRATDEPDRQGMTEIRYIEGLYAFWDELLRRHPSLVIDNCASGGRRIDLETVSRSVALWRTDYQYYEPNGYQCHTYGMSLYLPSTSTGSGYPEPYSFRSSINNGIVLAWNPHQPDIPTLSSLPFPVDQQEPFPKEQARLLIEEFKQIRHLFFGDFYPLTPYSASDDRWMAYQFHREDLWQGMVLAFRRPKCQTPTLNVQLKALSFGARYELTFEDGAKRILFGKDLADGLKIAIERAPGSLLITYSKSR